MEDVILFTVGEARLAIAASAVDEIRNLDGLTALRAGSAPSRLAKVRYTLVRGKKDRDLLYFVVDTGLHYKQRAAVPARVLVLRGTPTALVVEGIERMSQIGKVHPLPQAFHGEERGWYRGLAVFEAQGKIVPVVDPESFLSKGEIAVLQANARVLAASAGREVPA